MDATSDATSNTSSAHAHSSAWYTRVAAQHPRRRASSTTATTRVSPAPGKKGKGTFRPHAATVAGSASAAHLAARASHARASASTSSPVTTATARTSSGGGGGRDGRDGFVEAAGFAPASVAVRVRVTATRRTAGCRRGESDASTRRTSARSVASSSSVSSTTRVAVQCGAVGRQRHSEPRASFVRSRTSSHSTAVRSPSPTPPASRAPDSSTSIATVSDVARTSARSASARATTRSATKAAASAASTAKVLLVVVVVVVVAGGGRDGDPAPSPSRSPLASRTRAGEVDSERDTLARRRMDVRAPSVSGAVEPRRQSRKGPSEEHSCAAVPIGFDCGRSRKMRRNLEK